MNFQIKTETNEKTDHMHAVTFPGVPHICPGNRKTSRTYSTYSIPTPTLFCGTSVDEGLYKVVYNEGNIKYTEVFDKDMRSVVTSDMKCRPRKFRTGAAICDGETIHRSITRAGAG
jgi:hypothetical protein